MSSHTKNDLSTFCLSISTERATELATASPLFGLLKWRATRRPHLGHHTVSQAFITAFGTHIYMLMPPQVSDGVGESLDVDSYLGHHLVALVHGRMKRLQVLDDSIVV